MSTAFLAAALTHLRTEARPARRGPLRPPVVARLHRKLPAVYRGVFVLCCLEGLSGPQAADRLGVKENTIFGRLARARKRLQQRLARRGISLVAVLAAVLAALAVSGAGRATPPVRLVRMTAATAFRLGAGVPVKGLSANVYSLAEGVIATMRPNITKLATVLLMVCALGTGSRRRGRWNCSSRRRARWYWPSGRGGSARTCFTRPTSAAGRAAGVG